jgi:hypothetical protein
VVLLNNLIYLGVQKVVGCALRAGVHYEAVHVTLHSSREAIAHPRKLLHQDESLSNVLLKLAVIQSLRGHLPARTHENRSDRTSMLHCTEQLCRLSSIECTIKLSCNANGCTLLSCLASAKAAQSWGRYCRSARGVGCTDEIISPTM